LKLAGSLPSNYSTAEDFLGVMSSSGRRAEALDVEGGKVYQEPKGTAVNTDTILPAYRNGKTAPPPTSPSGSVSDDHKSNVKDGKEVDLDATEPPHEAEHSEKSPFTKKLDKYAHIKRPIIHGIMVAFCLGWFNSASLVRDEPYLKLTLHFPRSQHGSAALLLTTAATQFPYLSSPGS
jgi:hypothetical protein